MHLVKGLEHTLDRVTMGIHKIADTARRLLNLGEEHPHDLL